MITIAYWTQSGNTKLMADKIAEGVKAAGKDARVVEISEISASELENENVFALGCPAMGAEELDADMDTFVAEVEKFAAGKTIGLFGSYGWGDGEWMREWEKRMIAAGATVLNDEGLICQEAPDADAEAACKSMGEALAGV
ncbi:MAG: flavodoxin [Lachnospiraceae bacterium]|nr:flavodoxin [Lachnospiraceae bacterium]